jgi:Kef-type K+ transport system membrane component KefB
MSFIEAILLLLVLSRIGGEVAERYGQPAMIGEIAAGVILGPSVLGAIRSAPEISALAELGVLLLVFMAGMEMAPAELWNAFRGRGAWVGVMGFIVPLAAGLSLGLLFGFDNVRSIFLGLCVAITALPVSIRMLMDMGYLQSQIGRKIISAAVMNDVVALLILGVLLDVESGPGGAERFILSLSWTLAKAVLFMASIVLAFRLVSLSAGRIAHSRRALDWLLTRMRAKEPLFALILLFVFGFATFAEALGLHFVIGAFFGSMLLSHEMLGEQNFREVEKTASTITMGFLGPIFFAAIGLEFDIMALTNWNLVVGVLAVAFAGKILGGYWGGRLAGLPKRESWGLGVGLNGRGIMELIIAKIALINGLIGPAMFTVLVLMGVVTTLVTPLLLRKALPALPAEPSPEPHAVTTSLNVN